MGSRLLQESPGACGEWRVDPQVWGFTIKFPGLIALESDIHSSRWDLPLSDLNLAGDRLDW